MKKVILCFIACLLVIGISQPANADSPTVPTLISFTMTPDTVDVATANTIVKFDLAVSNLTGIASNQTRLTLTDGANNTLVAFLVRTDLPINNSLTTVRFQGSLVIPPNLPTGVYTASVTGITSLNQDGTPGFSTGTLVASTTSKLTGALNSLIVRNTGILNYSYPTFIGPTFNNILGKTFIDPKFSFVGSPIWKVGEVFYPKNYYELAVPSLTLKIKSNSPSVCTSDGTVMNLVSVGSCSFTVYTDKNSDYQLYQDNEIVNISSGRIKPVYTLGTIASQSSSNLPLTIAAPFVYGPVGVVNPVSVTPTVCYASATFVTVISGGTCTLNYSTPASSTYLASDVYPLTFEITRSAQTVAFASVPSAPIVGKTLSLSATSTSGLPITFQSDSPSICSVNGSSLNLLKSGSCVVEAVQSGSATIAPASLAQTILVSSAPAPSKKIVCVKAGKSKVFVGTKCPTGYKVKK